MAAPPTTGDSFEAFQTNITTAKAQSTQTNGHTISRGPSPNRGATVPDNETKGPDSIEQTKWLDDQNIDKSNWIHLKQLSHMRYQHEDLNTITVFLKGLLLDHHQTLLTLSDFGMRTVKKTDTERWYAGYGPDQYVYYARQGPRKFLGGAFEVHSYEDLEK